MATHMARATIKPSQNSAKKKKLRKQSAQRPAKQLKQFQKALLGWFAQHRRELPWRASRDPYRVWVAEVMLQQTRIAAVIPYYDRFLARFPDVHSLAAAREHDVLKLWSGLGYYSRGRNLHRAARKIVKEHEAQFPREHDAALALPGIGSYTAAAVLSIAYDVPLAVLDGNVARVLARLNAIRGDLREPGNWRQLGQIAENSLAREAAGDWNQALMELGEVVCTPQIPRCPVCPVARWCHALRENLVGEIPAPRKKRAPVKIQIAAAILRDPQGQTILVKDPGAHDDVLFSRMWQFPAVQVAQDAETELREHVREILGVASVSLQTLPAAKHGVTFRNITLLPYLATVKELPKRERTRIIALNRLRTLPVSSATHKIAAAAVSALESGLKTSISALA
jgi:A/G-specific adenine glycosylase